jgi:hypothetical protein
MTPFNRSLSLPLVAADWLVLLLFVFAGQRDHSMPVLGALPSLFTTALALALPWTAAAWAMGAAALPVGIPARGWLSRVAAAWLIAAPLGLLLRALLRGQAAIIVPFMLVILGVGGLVMVGWRGAVYWSWNRRRERERMGD